MCASEGTPTKPIEIVLDEYHFGCVGPEKTSYYKLSVPFRADIYIEVTDHLGDAELFLFGEDATYNNWLSSSQGYEMNVESYFTPSGATLYFTVVDYADNALQSEASQGEQYTVYAYPDYLLNSTGIFISGEIYEQAISLETGKSSAFVLGPDALEYFKTTASEAGTLVIKAEGLPQDTELKWVDADGQYSAVSITSEEDMGVIEISDVGVDTTCFFYVVGAPDTQGSEFTMSVAYKLKI